MDIKDKRGEIMDNIFSIVLAAGKGTRMKSRLPKHLHKINGEPMIGHIVDSLKELKSNAIITVVGYKSEMIKEYLGGKISFVEQKEQLGTGHAVLQVEPILKNKEGVTVVINGDTPLITSQTLKGLVNRHTEKNAAATILTMETSFPKGYGRIVRGKDGEVLKIVEEKDASAEEKRIQEVNSGTYCFDNLKLFKAVSKINNNNEQKEYYLTDAIEILKAQDETVSAFQTADPEETIGINDRIDLAKAEKISKNRILNKIMEDGVTIIDPEQTYIEKDVKIGIDTIIYPGTYLKGYTTIGENCIIGPNADITDTKIGDNVTITYSIITTSLTEDEVIIGPFAYIRPNSHISAKVKIGDFVEIKNSYIGDRTKVPHLSYIGDASVGDDVNIGCGTITVNFDGFKKHTTIIESRSFVGCNTNLIAPVTIGEDAYIAAGSTITTEVPDFALAIARERQTNKENYVKKIREENQSKTD